MSIPEDRLLHHIMSEFSIKELIYAVVAQGEVRMALEKSITEKEEEVIYGVIQVLAATQL